ncbi:hypothetical protein PAXINDRAFT_15317 [Paxillus involutus ATCC 200175]|uniref:Uncharacterized protein n=1 Tax=Paxillus involutus ATCC 200175 TaxID=664439 RepID=A0A0C9TVU5_PAXIN|nr:hypothetical protein PAXINDRAFT_15317 [Paxillus involutus ATCC 200175]
MFAHLTPFILALLAIAGTAAACRTVCCTKAELGSNNQWVGSDCSSTAPFPADLKGRPIGFVIANNSAEVYITSRRQDVLESPFVPMYFLRRLLAILRIASRRLGRLISYLALRVPLFLRKVFCPLNCTRRTLHSRDHGEIRRPPTPPTFATTTPAALMSSSNSIIQTGSPPPGNNQASNSSSTSQSAGDANTQISQNPSLAPSCKPSLPDQMKRYRRTISIPKNSPKTGLKPGKQSLDRPEVPGWSSEVHPEGALFYWRKAESWMVLTDTDLTVNSNLTEVDYYVESILGEAKKFSLLPSDPLVLVVELANEDSNRTTWAAAQECLYYFVDHAEKLLFWVQEYPRTAIKKDLCRGVKCATENSHIKHAIEAQYWMYCERFSNMVPMRPEYLNDLRETLIHANTILSDTSVAPFAPDDLLKMLDVVSAIESSVARSKLDPHSTNGFGSYPHSISAIGITNLLYCCGTLTKTYPARMMKLFTHSKFLNFHGQPGARLNADQSIYNKPLASEEGFTSPVFYTLNILLLAAPRKYMQTLRGLYVDRFVNGSRWKGFISGLKDEWNGYTVFVRIPGFLDCIVERHFNLGYSQSTVMLAVDISFLAVPGVINGSFQISQTPTAITVYISTILSLGTLIVSVLLADQIRMRGIESVKEGTTYMARMTNTVLGIEAMAVMYSLPYALLVWSMLAFGVALSTMMFSSLHKIALVVVAIFFAVVVVLASWPITCGRGRHAAKSKASLRGGFV